MSAQGRNRSSHCINEPNDRCINCSPNCQNSDTDDQEPTPQETEQAEQADGCEDREQCVRCATFGTCEPRRAVASSELSGCLAVLLWLFVMAVIALAAWVGWDWKAVMP